MFICLILCEALNITWRILSYLNSDPKNIQSRQELASKFEAFRSNNFFEAIDSRETQTDTIQTDSKRPKTIDLDVSIKIGDDYGGLFPEHDKITKKYIYSILFSTDKKLPSDYDGPNYQTNYIIYREAVAQKAREFLRSTYYHGKWIIRDGTINPEVYRILQEKFSKGESFSKLEYIIADVASFFQNEIDDDDDDDTITMCDGGYDRALVEQYEEATGKEAFVNNLPTEEFNSWYDSKQATINREDVRSPMVIQTIQDKKDRLKQVIIEQLQHYSLTGERLYSKDEVVADLTFSEVSVKKHAKIILNQIFTDPESASLIYDMIFGVILTSYQKAKVKFIEQGLLLKTNPAQWLDMLKERGRTSPSKLKLDYQCMAKGHQGSMRISRILSCQACMVGHLEGRPLDFQNILNVASEHNIQAISFRDGQQLTEGEFQELVKVYKSQHQDPDDYKSKTLVHLNLKWKCLEFGHVFERSYRNIKDAKVKHYCPTCFSSIDQQITLEKAEDAFQGHITQSFRSNEQLYKFLPERILLMDKYQAISDPRCHVDAYGFVSVAGKEFKIAIESQGPQHYSFAAYLKLAKSQDLKKGIYKTDEQYIEDFSAQVERDRVKVELFKYLNKDGYYLIVVPHWKSPSERKAFIFQEFIRQTKVNPSDVHIVDFL